MPTERSLNAAREYLARTQAEYTCAAELATLLDRTAAEAHARIEELEAERLLIQRAIAKTATGDDGSEDDDVRYTIEEIVGWIDREESWRVRGQHEAHARARSLEAEVGRLRAAIAKAKKDIAMEFAEYWSWSHDQRGRMASIYHTLNDAALSTAPEPPKPDPRREAKRCDLCAQVFAEGEDLRHHRAECDRVSEQELDAWRNSDGVFLSRFHVMRLIATVDDLRKALAALDKEAHDA